MKKKSHSGAKKRVKRKGKKNLFMQKACKNHRLTSKSKRQKNLDPKGKEVHKTNERALLRMLPKGY